MFISLPAALEGERRHLLSSVGLRPGLKIDVLVAVIWEQLGHHLGGVLGQPEAPDI